MHSLANEKLNYTLDVIDVMVTTYGTIDSFDVNVTGLTTPACRSNATSYCPGDVICEENRQPGASILSPILLSIAGISGQIGALVYLYRNTRKQNARTVFYLMLSTLICTDFVGKILTTPQAIISYAYGRWIGGENICKTHGYCMTVIGLVTHCLVSVMAIERYLGIRHGYFYNKQVTTSRTKLLLMSIWLFAVLFCALPLLGFGEFRLQYPGTWCYVNIHVCENSPWQQRLYTNMYGVINLINFLVIVCFNVIVVGTLLKMRLTRKHMSKSCHPVRSRKQTELEIQMVILLVVITFVFFISWAPIDSVLFTNQIWQHGHTIDHLVDLIAIRLASFNQIVDPWAYIISRVIFRSRAWKCCRRAVLGRNFSRRGEEGGGSFMNSFLGNRRISRGQGSVGSGYREKSSPEKVVKAESPNKVNETDNQDKLQDEALPDFEQTYTGQRICQPEGPISTSNFGEKSHPEQNLTSPIVPICVFTDEQYRLTEKELIYHTAVHGSLPGLNEELCTDQIKPVHCVTHKDFNGHLSISRNTRSRLSSGGK